MFYCSACAFDLGWPWYGHFTSYGRCETCYANTECADVPSSLLLLKSSKREQVGSEETVRERRIRNRSAVVIQEEP